MCNVLLKDQKQHFVLYNYIIYQNILKSFETWIGHHIFLIHSHLIGLEIQYCKRFGINTSELLSQKAFTNTIVM